MERVLVVPAAGRGSRLSARGPKALVRVAGRPMLERLVLMHREFVSRIIVVVAPAAVRQFQQFVSTRDEDISLAVQDRPTGMLDAILASRPNISGRSPDRVVITWCDQIAVSRRTIVRLANRSRVADAPALVFPTIAIREPYIHFQRDAEGRLVHVCQRREGDSMPAQGESDMGLFDLSGDAFLDDLPVFATTLDPAEGTGERNFLPFIPWLAARRAVETVPGTSAIEAIGVNTRDELARLEKYLGHADRASQCP